MKLLFLTSRFPYPLEKGDKLRAYHFIRSLSIHADIYLFALCEELPAQEALDALRPFCKAIAVHRITKADSLKSMVAATFNGLPFQVAYFYKKQAMQELEEFIIRHQPTAVFCHLIRMSEYARQSGIHPSLLDYMDAFSQGMQRYGEDVPFFLRPFVNSEKRRLMNYENEIFNSFDKKIIISGQDRNWIPHPGNKSIEVVPNGVDFGYYRPGVAEKKYDLVFLGNMAYPPNIKAVSFTVKYILPELNKLRPASSMLIAGATPSAEVRQLASSQVTVSGWVDDPLLVLNESKVLVAPMLISIGLQNKILQAMAMKIPCVISSAANNAIGAREEECVLTASTPAEYASQINRVLTDENLRLRLTENAYRFVHEKFNWDKSVQTILSLLKN